MGDDNRQYKSRLRIPDDRVLLNLKQDEVDELKAMEIRKGKTITEGESHFTGYVCDVKTIDEVNRAYEYVRFHNFNARHIICAFRLPGPVFPEYQDYEDWDEHNAGRTLLDYMIDAELENRAIFIVRNYEGTHIGAKRFECLIDVAKWAVNYKPE